MDPNHSDLPTPVRWKILDKYLEGYPTNLRRYLIDGFRYGFRVNYSGERCSQTSPNLKAALESPDIIEQKLETELSLGRIAGPFDSSPFPQFKISPLGLVPKRQPGHFRLIHHLSYPRTNGTSVNAGIDKAHSAVSYAGIADAVSVIKKLGTGCYMAKTDIKSAFRILPVHADDYALLGFSWKGKLYYDRRVAMGCASSCLTFETFSTALEWVARHKLGCTGVVHILDDFLFLETSLEDCEQALDKFLQFCSSVVVPIAEEKTYHSKKVKDFVGISLDSIKMEARLPLDKLEKCQSLLHEFLDRKSCKRRELESLIGF